MSARRPPKQGLLSKLAQPFRALGRLGAEKPPQETIVLEHVEDRVVDEAFTLALDAMLTEDEGRFQAKLQVISLVEFREAVGDKWPRLKEKVMLIAEGVINLHLGPGNVCGRKGDDFYILLFRAVPPPEGRRRAVIIAQELGTRLVGAQFAGAERPLALAAEIALDLAIGPDGGLDLAAIEEAVGEVRSLIEPTKPSGTFVPHLHQLKEEEGRIHRIGRPTGEQEGPQRVKDPTWVAVGIEGRPRVSDAPADDDPPPLPGDAALSLRWRPCWMAEGEVIGAYLAHLIRADSPATTPLEGARAFPRAADEAAFALNRFTIGATVRELKSMDFANSRALAVLPIHWSGLAGAQRMTLLAPLGDLPEGLRRTRLAIDLFGVPDEAPDDQLAQVIGQLGPLCRRVMLRTRLGHPRVQRAANLGIEVIGIDLAQLAVSERTDDEHLLAELALLRRQTEAAGLGVYAWGIRRRPVVMGTVLGGYSLMNGPGLMKDLPKPAKVLPAPRSRFAGPPQ
jgi:hypothetical protein